MALTISILLLAQSNLALSAPLKEASNWMDHYRIFWEQSFDRLDDYLKSIQLKSNQKKQKGKKNGREK